MRLKNGWIAIAAMALVAGCGPGAPDKKGDNSVVGNNSQASNVSNSTTPTNSDANSTANSNTFDPDNTRCEWDEYPREDGGCTEFEQFVDTEFRIDRSLPSGNTFRSLRVCVRVATGADGPDSEPDVIEGDCEAYIVGAGNGSGNPVEPEYETRGDSAGRITVSNGESEVALVEPNAGDNCYVPPEGTWIDAVEGGENVTVSIDGSDAIEPTRAVFDIPRPVEFETGTFVHGEPHEVSWTSSGNMRVGLVGVAQVDGNLQAVSVTCDPKGATSFVIPGSMTALLPDQTEMQVSTSVTATYEEQSFGERSFARFTASAAATRDNSPGQ